MRAKAAAQTFKPYGFAFWHSFHYTDDYSEPLIARMSGAKAWVYTKKAMGWGSRAWLLRSYLATQIVADNSEMPKLFFDRFGLRSKVRVIHHGIPLNVFAPCDAPKQSFRQSLSIPEKNPLIVCVAHLVPVKGHPTLIQAIARIPGVHLGLAGKTLDQAYTQSLVQLSELLGISDRVHFLGGVSDVPGLLNEADLFVLPTWAKGRMEGCPVAVLEAMACGCACIVTDIPGSRELVEHQKSGWIVPPENPEVLAEAIRVILETPGLREELGKSARARAESNFSIEREVASHEQLYRELLK